MAYGMSLRWETPTFVREQKRPISRKRLVRHAIAWGGRLTLAGLLVAGLLVVIAPEPLWACASCNTGDPTLTVMGTEQPFAGRKRFSLETLYREDRIGDPTLEGYTLQELRTELSFAWTPRAAWTLSAQLPLVARQVTYVNLAADRVLGLGDAELWGRRLLWRDASFMTRHLLTLQAGLKLPTAPLAFTPEVAGTSPDAEATPLDPSAQPGSGAWVPSVRLAYAFFAQPFSAYLSLTGTFPSRGYLDEQAGASLSTSSMAQWQPLDRLSLRAGLDVRRDAPNRVGAATEPDSGGLIAFAALGAVFSPAPDVLVQLGGTVPVLNALEGYHIESPLIRVGVVYDF